MHYVMFRYFHVYFRAKFTSFFRHTLEGAHKTFEEQGADSYMVDEGCWSCFFRGRGRGPLGRGGGEESCTDCDKVFLSLASR